MAGVGLKGAFSRFAARGMARRSRLAVPRTGPSRGEAGTGGEPRPSWTGSFQARFTPWRRPRLARRSPTRALHGDGLGIPLLAMATSIFVMSTGLVAIKATSLGGLQFSAWRLWVGVALGPGCHLESRRQTWGGSSPVVTVLVHSDPNPRWRSCHARMCSKRSTRWRGAPLRLNSCPSSGKRIISTSTPFRSRAVKNCSA